MRMPRFKGGMTRSAIKISNDALPAITCISVAACLRATPWALQPHATQDTHHFVWINKGAGRVHVNGTTRGFAPNSAFFLPAGTVFGFDLTPACFGWIIAVPTSIDPFGWPAMRPKPQQN